MYGPLEYIAIGFEGNQFKGEIIPALQELVDKQIIRVIDLVVIKKDQDGVVTTLEVEQTDQRTLAMFNPLIAEHTGMFTPDDLQTIGDMLDNNSTAGLMLFEHTYATKFAQAVINANGRVLARETVPYEIVNESLNMKAAAN